MPLRSFRGGLWLLGAARTAFLRCLDWPKFGGGEDRLAFLRAVDGPL